jgi:hypothetical protein
MRWWFYAAAVLFGASAALAQQVYRPVTIVPFAGSYTDCSTLVGKVATPVLAANPDRNSLYLYNNSGSPIWISFTTAAVGPSSAGSILLPAGGNSSAASSALFYTDMFVPTNALTAIAASAASALTCWQN